MDDIVVLILTLIFIAAGIFGQAKKKRVAPQPEVKNVPEQDDFWEMLDDEWKKTKQADINTPQKPNSEDLKKNLRKEYQFNAKTEGERIAQKMPVEKIKTNEKLSAVKSGRFSLRDAVVYSEILNRKYT
ncbi:hypothetical protein SAMN05444274_10538 [Mariniphaga anaerophila]|uniref:Uncharacterized protein n=1 Tax=Mariniphaga anaerophila TaxID=1484053 RepID=A0A1M5BA25_9BACT|nr:hypothetical protein [Mariniphaga anaerophila]SHF39022.1 hypothetical protein SAMN05444274_10538 [Mariniphaga anaerophila]